MTKNTPGEIRAAVMRIEEAGGLPTGLLQSLYEHNTGYRDEQTALPKHRQSGQDKETEIVDAGLRLQQKMGEFGNNQVLGTHAFMYGDKRTTDALQNGFSQDEIDNTIGVLARVGKYGGEPLNNEGLLALSQSIGLPSRDINTAANAPPPKPVVPRAKASVYVGDSIAVGAGREAGAATFANVGDNPNKVLATIRQLPAEQLQGTTVKLSSGLSNLTDADPAIIKQQIQTLKDKGAEVVLMGVADNFKNNSALGGQLNGLLSGIAQETGVAFAGGFKGVDKAGVHPDYKTLNSSMGDTKKAGGISSLRSALFGGESGGNYNIVNRGKRHGYTAGQENLTEKTVDQVIAEQASGRYNAAGAYQIIYKTLRAAKKTLGLSGNEKFTPQLQDRIFADYLAKAKRPPLRDYIVGKSNNLKAAHTALAQEWASVDRGDGLSYYHNDGVNKAHIPLQKTINAVQDMRNQYQANIQNGMSQDEAYRQALIGGTAVAQSGTATQGDGSLMGSLGFSSPTSQVAETTVQNEIPTPQTNDTAQSIKQRQLVETPQTNWQEIAKKAFSTKRQRYVPKYVSQAVRGAIKGV